MPTSTNNLVPTSAIIIIIIGSTFGVLLCIASIAIVVSIIRHCNRSRHSRTEEVIVKEPYPIPHSWATHYPPYITSVSNYPALYPSVPPSYNASVTDYIKPTYP